MDRKGRFFIWGSDRQPYGRTPQVSRGRILDVDTSVFALKANASCRAAFTAQLSIEKGTLFGPPAMEARFDTVTTEVRKGTEAEAMRWGSTDMLKQRSDGEINPPTHSFPTGVEDVRPYVSNVGLIRDDQTIEHISRFQLLKKAAGANLCTGEIPDE